MAGCRPEACFSCRTNENPYPELAYLWNINQHMSVLLNSCTPVSLNNLPNTVSRRIVRNRNRGVARLGFTRRGGVRKTVSWQAAFGCSLGGRAASFRRFATVSAVCGFKLKWPVSHAKTGHIAVRNRPFRNAKRPVSRRVSRRSAPVAVLFVKWAHSAFFLAGRVAVCPPYMLCASSG